MQVPHDQCLNNQTFNSNFIEFVWQFPTDEGELNQIIFNVAKDGTTLLEEGVIDRTGEYKGREYLTSGIITTKNISMDKLITLKNEVVKFLNGL
jgi:hypothetical protein